METITVVIHFSGEKIPPASFPRRKKTIVFQLRGMLNHFGYTQPKKINDKKGQYNMNHLTTQKAVIPPQGKTSLDTKQVIKCGDKLTAII